MSLFAQTESLKPCPDSPNCVQSFDASDQDHYIDPISIKPPAGQSISDYLVQQLQTLPRVKITEQRDDYLHAEFTTLIMRFVDDVEIVIDAEQQLLHVRSASRTGYSDFNANRKRVEMLRTLFQSPAT